MRPSKRPVYLFHSPLFTQRTPPHVPFRYSIPFYLLNASLKSPLQLLHSPLFTQCAHQTSRLAIPFPAIYPMRPHKRPV